MLITLELHEKKLKKIIFALKSLTLLNQETKLFINEKMKTVYAYTLIFIDDFSQQQENAEFKAQSATLDC